MGIYFYTNDGDISTLLFDDFIGELETLLQSEEGSTKSIIYSFFGNLIDKSLLKLREFKI
ncbi:MAG: hypothetical protein NY202_05175 [Mollicutes bacterium UO1]